VRAGKWLVVVLVGVVVAGCGYHFRGRATNLPKDIHSIAIPVFANHTAEVGIERIFTDEVIYQFNRSRILNVVDLAKADAVLRGSIDRVDITDVAYTSSDTSRQRRVRITISAKLVRTRDGKVIWRGSGIVDQRTYDVADDPTQTEQNKTEAITTLAQAMARTLHDRVFENF